MNLVPELMVVDRQPKILRLNLAGLPIEWLNWQEAVCLYARDLVA